MRANIKQTLAQRWRGVIAGAVIGGALAAAAFAHFTEGLQHLSFDYSFRFRRMNLNANDVLIIYIDDESGESLHQQPGSMWDRRLYATLLNQLTSAGAKMVIFDVLLTEPGNPEADKQLAEAIARNKNVILGGTSISVNEGGLRGYKLQPPLESFAKGAYGWGLVNYNEDSDRVNRRHYGGTDEIPSLALAAARALKANVVSPKDAWINYYGPPGWIPYRSFATVYGTNVPASLIEGKSVFIGSLPTASILDASLDKFPTPFTRDSIFWGKKDDVKAWTQTLSPGVEVHATQFLNLVRGDYLQRLPAAEESVILILLGAVAGAGLVLLSTVWAAVGAFAVGLLFATGYSLLWHRNVWFAWMVFICLQLPISFVWSVVYNSVRLHIEKRLLQQSLALHLSPARVAQILARPDLLKPGAEKQEVTIMFTDIANFSKLSSRMEADDLFKLLNDYFERALSVIHKNDGTVVKLIGDSIFAIWNAPFVQPHQQFMASKAALELQSEIIQLEAQQRSAPLRTRIGIHTGSAFVGNVGSSKRFDYTAIGDSINLSSRLEGLNKHLGTEILTTRELHKIIESKVTARKVGFFKFKGFDRVAEIYEVVGPQDIANKTAAWRDLFEGGLFAFQRRDWNAAEAAFKNVLAARPDDGPSLFYLERILEFRAAPPQQDWTGEIEMREK